MSDKEKKKVLFVDDDGPFLELIERLFATWSQGEWQIFTATNTGKALGIIQAHPVDLVVIDMLMPVVDGLQFLKLINRKYPNLTKAALTSKDDENYRAACLNNGAELYLIKPTSIDALETVFANLNELINLQDQKGFRGVLRRVGLQDVLQLECLGTKSSILEVATSKTRGRVYIREGRIVHAQQGDWKGVDAFYRIMGLRGGDFRLKPFEEPAEETIQESWEMLLMEAARLNDEGEMDPNAAPAAIEAAPAAELPWEKEDFQAAEEAVVEPGPSSTVHLLKPRVEKMLVCSPQGDVLYEWQCGNTEAVIEMLEFITQQTRLIAGALPVGKCDRLEILEAGSRTVTHFEEDFALVVRTANSPLQTFARPT